MSAASLDYASAFLGGAIALIAAFRERRSKAVWFLVAGMALLVIVGVMFAPLFHRFLHHFHLVEDEGKPRP